MWLVAASLLAISTFGAALLVVLRAMRRPLPLAAPLALAVVVCFEAILLRVLSLWNGVTRPGVLLGHLAPLAAILAWRLARGMLARDARCMAHRARWSLRSLGAPALLIAPLAVAAAASARFAPNNWDSMVYHLARVAHWIQNGSVAVYPTHVDRQNVLQPAAEYLLTSVQVVAGSDRLANGLQLAAWAMLALAAPSLARLAGAPRRVSLWCAPLVASLPMGVLQASSTQNDLVAAVLALAVVAAAVPFLHPAGRPRDRDAALLGVALAAATVVKVTALVAAAPLLAFAAAAALRLPRGRRSLVASWRGLLGGIAVLAAVVGPEVRRFGLAGESLYVSHFTYAMLGGGTDRIVGLGRAVARHVPVPSSLVKALGMSVADWCTPGETFCTKLLLPNENSVGNPLHVLLAAALIVLAVVRWKRMPPRAHAFFLAPPLAWLALHLVFRDNEWISRLETPVFALFPLLLAATAGVGVGARWARNAASLVTALAVAHGSAIAYRNLSRPPFGDAGDEVSSYYANNPQLRRPHDIALEIAGKYGCRRLGLVMGLDSYDYPLTWRAMQNGIEVRHVFGRDPWPCFIFAERLPAATPEMLGWRRTALPFLYVNGR